MNLILYVTKTQWHAQSERKTYSCREGEKTTRKAGGTTFYDYLKAFQALILSEYVSEWQHLRTEKCDFIFIAKRGRFSFLTSTHFLDLLCAQLAHFPQIAYMT